MNYWIATDEGLYVYDYQNIKKLECNESKSNAVFGFVINKQGTIYCHNLNNQIFQISNNHFTLFYEISSTETSTDISLSIGDDDCLLIGAGRIIALNHDGKIARSSGRINAYLGQPFVDVEDKVYYPIQGSDSIFVYAHGLFSKQKLTVEGTVLPQALKFFKINNQNYAIDLITNQGYLWDTKNLKIQPTDRLKIKINQGTRFYTTGNVVWVAGLLPGVTLLEQSRGEIKINDFYRNYYISNVFQDNEGNFLLSTFDKGILVISDLQVPEVIQSFQEDPITTLYSDSTLGLLMGSSRGKVFKYKDAQQSLINKKGKRSIEKIYGSVKSDLIIFDDDKTKAYNKKNQQTTTIFDRPLKDVVFLSANEFYIGTNTGIFKCHQHPDNKFSFQTLDSSAHYRIYSLAYHELEKRLYAASSSGLMSIDELGQKQLVKYEGKDIYPTSRLYYMDGKVYAADRKYGILVIKQSKIIRIICPEVNGEKVVISKTIIKDNSLFAKTSNGLYQFDMNGKLIKSIQSVFGFANKRVIDFTFHKDVLWVSHSGGVQQIDLQYYHANLFSPIIKINKLFINDTPQNVSTQVHLKNKERKISFELSSPTLRNRETIRYHYRLLGYDDKWQSNNYNNNTITYNALSYGNYVFQVKAENQGKYSKVVFYSFSIAQPYYTRWWFLVSMIILFVVIVLIIYRWQLNLQHKKNEQINELNTSKLTAIKSQMNPHFIFNSLNSIQDLILKGDVENSYSYITTFSNLVRHTLNHSEQEFIDFEQEVKLLELYLSLEKLRFKKNLNYSIETKNMEDIMLPPLIIQPFIENALVHGLLHKEGPKELKISF